MYIPTEAVGTEGLRAFKKNSKTEEAEKLSKCLKMSWISKSVNECKNTNAE